jgi:hypothetical protein
MEELTLSVGAISLDHEQVPRSKSIPVITSCERQTPSRGGWRSRGRHGRNDLIEQAILPAEALQLLTPPQPRPPKAPPVYSNAN